MAAIVTNETVAPLYGERVAGASRSQRHARDRRTAVVRYAELKFALRDAFGRALDALMDRAPDALAERPDGAGQLSDLVRPALIFGVATALLLGSILVFVLYVVVLRYWNASRAAYVFVVVPVVTGWLDPGLYSIV